jgi:G3E family GTPase
VSAEPELAVTLVTGWTGGSADRTGVDLAAAVDRTTLLRADVADPDLGTDIGTITLDEDVAHRSPGCPCCAVRLDLIEHLGVLGRRRRPPARAVVVQAPGSDVATAVTTVLDDPELARHCRLDGIVTCVPGPQVAATLAEGVGGGWPSPRLLDAVMLADVVLVDGTERLTDDGARRVLAAVRNVNPHARVAAGGTLDPRTAIDLRSWSLHAPRARMLQRVDAHSEGNGTPAPTGPVVLRTDRPLAPRRLEGFFAELHGTTGARLLRVDAVLDIAGDDRRNVALGCRTVLRSQRGRRWGPSERRESRLRVVGRELDVDHLAEVLDACTV